MNKCNHGEAKGATRSANVMIGNQFMQLREQPMAYTQHYGESYSKHDNDDTKTLVTMIDNGWQAHKELR